jgi:hypothetical protein
MAIDRKRLLEMVEAGPAVQLSKEQITKVLDYIDAAGVQGVSGREIYSFVRDEFDVPPNQQAATVQLVLDKLKKDGEIEAFSRKVASTKKKTAA